jgi:hypothetical protein
VSAGLFYFSCDRQSERGFASDVRLFRFTGEAPEEWEPL